MQQGHTIKVLDFGHVIYIDHMGSDAAICSAARVSYNKGGAIKTPEDDQRLINRLYRDRHCYHGDMQVLTADGWKFWKDCRDSEVFLVPDNGLLLREECKLERFHVEDEKMCCFKNQRMSYCVTHDHRMLFKEKNSKSYKIVRASEMKQWGHFKPSHTHKLDDVGEDTIGEHSDAMMRFVGFFLGDGSGASSGTISFHLRKRRKINYLRRLCAELCIQTSERPSATYSDAVVITVKSPNMLHHYVDHMMRAHDKRLLVPLSKLSPHQIAGLFDGLVNSDGSIKKDRPQIEYSSASKNLAELFQNCACMLGMDAHFCAKQKGVFSVKAHRQNGRTSLEARKQYFSCSRYTGDVYCATTSTGLLVVRGGEGEFGFICGNTSPFEMAKVVMNIKMPIFIARQYIRHRMQNVNEVSARYTELPEEFYYPAKWRLQDTKNKQGSVSGELDHAKMDQYLRYTCEQAYASYKSLILHGVAREMARMVLPLNIYTEMRVCWDMKNLLHFITLREDSHAQAEIQDYGRAIKSIVTELFPMVMNAYGRYQHKVVDTQSEA